MPHTLDPDLRRALAERVRYCHEMGIYDFYRREPRVSESATGTAEVDDLSSKSLELREEMAAKKSAVVAKIADESIFRVLTPNPEQAVPDPIAALKLIREDLGDCTRCKLHKQGRKQIVFGVGNPHAELMFVGEGPGADEDTQGEPFVGRAGQLLNNMIKAMGIRREDVYIANIVKCRPPGNRTPERDERETCSPSMRPCRNCAAAFTTSCPRAHKAAILRGRERSSLSPIILHFCCATRARRAKRGRICRWS